ncbi:zinc finger protein hangover isoform X2 [Uranotaenia lowii]|uniref:zinc finger protein hangover isoform X2 n=1 Tax=Uranotaenia lowii TaxID=190385 RepID=UPI00247984D9|nr:zinc finger protein hangover isoform X2 [Uranotaenia lowii]
MNPKNCCRLCLAPETECVHIFNNFAADKQRLDKKIYSCVHLQVVPEDSLSANICHACISYLNSWQSFKNRCDAADRKLRNNSNQDVSSRECSSECTASNLDQVKKIGANCALENGSAKEKNGVNSDTIQQLEKLRENGINIILASANSIKSKVELDPIKNEPQSEGENEEGCKICNQEFKQKINLHQHILESHPEVERNKASSSSSCKSCQQTFDNPGLLGEHLKNYDCIIFILCCSCGERFDNNSKHVDHVHQCRLLSQTVGQDEYGYDVFDQEGVTSSSQLRNPQNCPVCNKQYNNYYNVLRHMEAKHPNQLPQIYQCCKCSEGFPRQTELRDHMQSTHGESASRHSKQQSSVQEQVLTGNKTRFSCMECDKPFSQMGDWIDHQHLEHGSFICLKCDFRCNTRDPFIKHCFKDHNNFTPVTKVQLYSCQQCSNTYSSIDALQGHIKGQHTTKVDDVINQKNEEKDLVKVSNSSTGSGLDENNSMAVHRKTLNCGLCDFVLTDIDALRQHMSEIHGMDKKFFYCNQCNAKFMNDKGLRVHLFRQHGIRDDIHANNLGISLLNPLTFIHQGALIADETVGIDSAPAAFECQVCHTVYMTNEDLNTHTQAVHSNLERLPETSAPQIQLWFQCRYCSECFNTSKRLSMHMNTHEEYDQTDHSCKDCGGVYSTKKSLWVHRYKKHPKVPNPSSCELCSKTFFDKTELSYHSLHAHSETTVGSRNADNLRISSLDGGQSSRAPPGRTQEEATYQCDMCQKTFHILNALQVHRGWHFRSPDGRKVRNPIDIWQPDQLAPSKVKRLSQSHRSPSTYAIAAVDKSHKHAEAEVQLNVKQLSGSELPNNNKLNERSDMQKAIEEKNFSMKTEQRNVNEFEDTDETKSKFAEHNHMESAVCSKSEVANISQYSCELCLLHFTSANALRQHVSEHFVNGGFEASIQVSNKAKEHRSSPTDSTSSSIGSSSSDTSSSEDTCDTEKKVEHHNANVRYNPNT